MTGPIVLVQRCLHPGCATFLLLISLLGCESRSQKFVPTSSVAEQAVTKAMETWKSGQPAGPVPDTNPLIYVTDNSRKPQQKLAEYKILGEKAASHGRSFLVELSLTNPVETRQAEYIIVGIDPLWVFQRDDYELLMHWDHHMPPPNTAEPKP